MNRDLFILLRNLLAGLYLDEASIQRITQDAGIDPARIVFGTTAVAMWESVLTEADRVSKVGDLLDTVNGDAEYGSNLDFHKFYDSYRESINRSIKDKISEPLESIFEDTLENMTWNRWPALLCAWPTIAYTKTSLTTDQQELLNPFQAIKADEDLFLLAISNRLLTKRQLSRHLPMWARPMLDLQNTMFVGHAGTGKTATALIVAHELLRLYADVLPIYWPCQLTLTETHEQLDSFGEALAYTLVGYLSQNPKDYFDSHPSYKRAIAALLYTYFGPGDFLAHVFDQIQLTERPHLDRLLTDLSTQVPNVNQLQFRPTADNPHVFLRHIANTQLHSIGKRVVLFDIQATQAITKQSTEFSNSISQTITMLENAGLIIKAFFPFTPTLRVESRFQQIIQAAWQRREIRQIFYDRLLIFDNTMEGHLGMLCDPKSVNLVTTEERILDASNHIPGHLMYVGNLFVTSYHRKNRDFVNRSNFLDQGDVEDIFENLARIKSQHPYM